MNLNNVSVCVVGLGYVGLPLAIEFGRRYHTVGFDVSKARVDELNSKKDSTREVSEVDFRESVNLTITHDVAETSNCNVYIVTIPTPVDQAKVPNLDALKAATSSVARVLNTGDIVIFESTVFPGATEEVCVPILESLSGMSLNNEFYVGYSPERINPGDASKRLTDIVKVTSGSNEYSSEFIDTLYKSIIKAGTHKAPSIKVAEAAKVIENVQRDVNIALVNEFAQIFSKEGISTKDVLAAASTKWNFLNFVPGMVGGHCIGVDPYYLAHRAIVKGLHPEMILAGRRINDNMGAFVASEMLRTMMRAGVAMREAKVLIIGFTFKENCPDSRNTGVIQAKRAFEEFSISVDVLDRWADAAFVTAEYGFELVDNPPSSSYDAVLFAVPHRDYVEMGYDWISAFLKDKTLPIFDLKGALEPASNVMTL